jgi:heme oxygenase
MQTSLRQVHACRHKTRTPMLTPTVCSDSTSPDSLHQVLRARTQAAHEHLKNHPLLDGLTQADYPLRSYWLVLSAYYHFYRAMELLVESASVRLNSRFDYTPRHKHGWLRQDLVDSFHIDPEDAFWRPKRKFSPIRIEDQADLAGALYSIEGATHGGRLISRHIQAGRLDVTAEHGGRFFHGYGEQTASRWNEFLTFAGQACPDAERRDKAAHAALAVFAEIEAALDDYAARAGRNPRPRT